MIYKLNSAFLTSFLLCIMSCKIQSAVSLAWISSLSNTSGLDASNISNDTMNRPVTTAAGSIISTSSNESYASLEFPSESLVTTPASPSFEKNLNQEIDGPFILLISTYAENMNISENNSNMVDELYEKASPHNDSIDGVSLNQLKQLPLASNFHVENVDVILGPLPPTKTSFEANREDFEISTFDVDHDLFKDNDMNMQPLVGLDEDLLENINIPSFIERILNSNENKLRGFNLETHETEPTLDAVKLNLGLHNIENDYPQSDEIFTVPQPPQDSNMFENENKLEELLKDIRVGSEKLGHITFEQIVGKYLPMLEHFGKIISVPNKERALLKVKKNNNKTIDEILPRKLLLPHRDIDVPEFILRTTGFQETKPKQTYDPTGEPKFTFVALSVSKNRKGSPEMTVSTSLENNKNTNNSMYDINSRNESSENQPLQNHTSDAILQTLNVDKQSINSYTSASREQTSESNERNPSFARMIRTITKKQFSLVDILLTVCCTVAALLAIINLSVFIVHLINRKRGTINLSVLPDRVEEAGVKDRRKSKEFRPEVNVSSFASSASGGEEANDNYYNAETICIRPSSFYKGMPEFSTGNNCSVENYLKCDEKTEGKLGGNNTKGKRSNIQNADSDLIKLPSTFNEHCFKANLFPNNAYNMAEQAVSLAVPQSVEKSTNVHENLDHENHKYNSDAQRVNQNVVYRPWKRFFGVYHKKTLI